jgi:hypothetical protein
MPKADAMGLAPEKSAVQPPVPVSSDQAPGVFAFGLTAIFLVKSRSGGLGHKNARPKGGSKLVYDILPDGRHRD